ncbi:zinc carboxypeptidase-like isoform X2 [Bacillus rossius redtenbacheri]|uniref:zinc carboxypeptidase-like isoform X2 n=1 Tax=Bacillus rossius redtenbacheri TaxID=93214 RepID=UPI002FDCF592
MRLAAAALGGRQRYDGHRVYRLRPASMEQARALRSLQGRSADTGVSFWTEARGANCSVDVMVSPHELPGFMLLVDELRLHSELYIEDVQRLIDNEQPKMKSQASFSWDRYYGLEQIQAWLRSLSSQYPSVVTLLDAGSSYEGRRILGVRLSHKAGNKAVFIEGGIHAREWISPATVTYILNQLLTSTDSQVKSAVLGYDWYIFPSTNPDGYEYTHTTNRMWRKSRRQVGSDNGQVCYGVDLNRNWAFHWNENEVISTAAPCSETYPGPSAFSEAETSSLSSYIGNLTSTLKLYISFHSYGQKILAPYGVYGVEPSNEAALLSAGKAAAAALAKRYGTEYEVGSIVDIEYVAPGSSVDWARGTADVPFAFAYELRDSGQYGFLLPAVQILPTSQETLDSVLALLAEASKSF